MNPRAEAVEAAAQGLVGPLRILETGTIRNATSDVDGWSTLLLARLAAERGGRVWSVERNPDHVEAAKRVLGNLQTRVSWTVGDSSRAVRHVARAAASYSDEYPGVNLLYLDSALEPKLIVAEFVQAEPYLAGDVALVLDDTEPNGAEGSENPLHVFLGRGKGTLLIPYLVANGWTERVWKEGDLKWVSVLNPPAGWRAPVVRP